MPDTKKVPEMTLAATFDLRGVTTPQEATERLRPHHIEVARHPLGGWLVGRSGEVAVTRHASFVMALQEAHALRQRIKDESN